MSNPRIKVRSVRKRTNIVQNKTKPIVIPRIHQSESRVAKFYMFTYKIDEGRRRLTLHNQVYNYGPQKCPNLFNNVGRCPKGKKCRFAHGTLEILFHPLVYKTRPCSKKSACGQGKSCAWAHTDDELRVMREILGYFWGDYNPVDRRVRKGKKSGENRRIRVQPVDNRSESSSVSWRTSSGPSRTATPSSQKMPDLVSVPASPVVMGKMSNFCDEKEELFSPPIEKKQEMCSVMMKNVDPKKVMSEFEQWFRSGFDCDSARLPFREYLRRFEEKNLDDVSFLWEMYLGMYGKFVDVLVNEIGIGDGACRGVFVRHLCKYKNPMDVQGWMERVVGLPRYCDLFVEYERVDELIYLGFDDDDLAEMGIASVDHRARILSELKKFEKAGRN